VRRSPRVLSPFIALIVLLSLGLPSRLFAAPPDGECAWNAALDFRFEPTEALPWSLSMLGQDDATAEIAHEAKIDAPTRPDGYPTARRFGAAGNQRWSIHGGIGTEFDDNNDQGFLGVGYSYFIADGLSLDLELNGWIFNQAIEDAIGLNFNVLFRWHFLMDRHWSLYLDGGAGLLVSDQDVPANGSSFNFTPQIGVGASFDIGGDLRLMAGARWHHISNANLYDQNPGRDTILGYVALSFPF
jgi:hypothetical protein